MRGVQTFGLICVNNKYRCSYMAKEKRRYISDRTKCCCIELIGNGFRFQLTDFTFLHDICKNIVSFVCESI